MIFKYFYLAKWFLSVRFFGKRKPLQSVIFISDECNLACRHCHVYQKENLHIKSYAQIGEELAYCYKQGSRFVDFEGGEPMIWHDGEHDINSLIVLAKQIGFFSTTVTTNAQLPFTECKADSIWVSLDGLGRFHDQIRGQGAFEKLEKNLNSSNHPNVSVNMVINSLNYTNVRETIAYVKNSKVIKMISLNFHTPYEGTESLFLDWALRKQLIDEIIGMKRKGYPIMNSVSGLKLMKNNNFKKHCWVSNFILPDGTRLAECTGKSAGVCDRCGLCMAGEMNAVFHFKPDTLFAGLKLRG
ncbi:MAG: radical SAM protein [Bacteroidales bacterium]|nr:radical SAM protein [Bacteroidales bacterium]